MNDACANADEYNVRLHRVLTVGESDRGSTRLVDDIELAFNVTFNRCQSFGNTESGKIRLTLDVVKASAVNGEPIVAACEDTTANLSNIGPDNLGEMTPVVEVGTDGMSNAKTHQAKFTYPSPTGRLPLPYAGKLSISLLYQLPVTK